MNPIAPGSSKPVEYIPVALTEFRFETAFQAESNIISLTVLFGNFRHAKTSKMSVDFGPKALGDEPELKKADGRPS